MHVHIAMCSNDPQEQVGCYRLLQSLSGLSEGPEKPCIYCAKSHVQIKNKSSVLLGLITGERVGIQRDIQPKVNESRIQSYYEMTWRTETIRDDTRRHRMIQSHRTKKKEAYLVQR
jgi:hypothetical protein